MWPLYLQTIGLVPTIIGAKSATRQRKTTNASASIASLRRRKCRQASLQKPADGACGSATAAAVVAEVEAVSRLGTVLMGEALSRERRCELVIDK